MQIEELASEASTLRIESMKALLAAMIGSSSDQPSFEKLTNEFKSLGLIDTVLPSEQGFRALFSRPRDDPNSRRWSVLRNGLRFALGQLLAPSDELPQYINPLQPDWLHWIRQVQASLNLKSTPFPNEWPEPSANGVQLSLETTECLKNAINLQKQATAKFNELIELGVTCQPPLLLQIVHVVRKSRSVRSIGGDELLSHTVVRLANKIDAYQSGSNFLAWWRQLVDRCLLDLLAESNDLVSRHNADDPPTPVEELPCHRPETSRPQSEPFSERDWTTIRGWAEQSIKIPVVVCAGYGWMEKIKSVSSHWQEFSKWLTEYGVPDIEAYLEDSLQAAFETESQLNVLADHARKLCNTERNTVRNTFTRNFGGIQQSARQPSFGKKHHAVELEHWWQCSVFNGPTIDDDLKNQLMKASVEERVAALCCAPAWPLLRRLDAWNGAKANYSFVSTPPLLEFLRADLDIRPENRNLLPPSIRTNRQKLCYLREQILVHGTKGNFAQCLELVASARANAKHLEHSLTELWENTARG